MSRITIFGDIMATSTALASVIFMGIVFYNEAILGHGMLYIEPNRYIAFTELLFTIFGFGGTFGMWMRRLTK